MSELNEFAEYGPSVFEDEGEACEAPKWNYQLKKCDLENLFALITNNVADMNPKFTVNKEGVIRMVIDNCTIKAAMLKDKYAYLKIGNETMERELTLVADNLGVDIWAAKNDSSKRGVTMTTIDLLTAKSGIRGFVVHS